MKKKTVIIIAIFILLLLGIYLAFNKVFPRADAINIQNISSMYLSTGEKNDDRISLTKNDQQALISIINDSVPTRSMSLNDHPVVRPYYMIEVTSDKTNIRIFVYEDNRTPYIEIPYEGIYRVDRKIFDVINKYY